MADQVPGMLVNAWGITHVGQAGACCVKSTTGEPHPFMVTKTPNVGGVGFAKIIPHPTIDPLASVEAQKETNVGFVLAAVSVTLPSVKLNAAGVKAKLLRFGPRGCVTVNEPEMLHTGGHAKPPEKEVNGLPV